MFAWLLICQGNTILLRGNSAAADKTAFVYTPWDIFGGKNGIESPSCHVEVICQIILTAYRLSI